MTDRMQIIGQAQYVLDQADLAGRNLTAAERDEVNQLMMEAEIAKLGERMRVGVAEGSPGGLFAAIRGAGYDRKSSPQAVVPFMSAATFDGNYSDAVSSLVPAPPLGADRRFLYPSLRIEPVDPDTTSVASFRQKSRTLPALADAIRDLDETTIPKPEVATVTELANEPLHQIAVVETGVANIMLESDAFRGWINDDLTFAYSSAVDFHVLAQIAAAMPPMGDTGLDMLESILLAAEVVAEAGYSPSIVAASPQDLISLLLLKQPGTGGEYVFSGNAMPLNGLRRVAVPGLDVPMVLDPLALGVFHTSPTRFASFEENNGTTNSSTVRLESNGVFVVQRIEACAEIGLS